MILTLWLPVHDGSGGQHPLDGNAPHPQLWRTTRRTGCVPDRSDKVILWPCEEENDPLDGPSWTVRDRYMDAAGGWHIDLTRAVLDPEPSMWQRAVAEMGSRNCWNELHLWETSVDGDLREKLREAGWVKQ